MIDAIADAKLSAEEAAALERAVQRCRGAADVLIREIGRVHLRGMCDMLQVQGRLDPACSAQILEQTEAPR